MLPRSGYIRGMNLIDGLHPAAQRFLRQEPVKLHYGGGWHAAKSGKTFPAYDPGSGMQIAEIASSDAEDVDAAVRSAEDAFKNGPWAKMSIKERAAVMYRLAEVVLAHGEELSHIESADTGKTRAEAYDIDVLQTVDTLRYFADIVQEVELSRPLQSRTPGLTAYRLLEPYGVCAFIFPWNFPLGLLAWGIAPALAAGNTVVVKPPEDASLSILAFCQLLAEAGVPDGVVNVICGDGKTTGAALASHPRIKRMSFTGSTVTGKAIATACAQNIVSAKLELGGKGAAVVFEDMRDSIPAVAEALCGAITTHAGQICCTATRWVIHRDLWDEFVAKAKSILEGLVIGHGSNPATKLGPVISQRQRARVLGYVEKGLAEGAKPLVAGGPATVSGYPDGYYVKPALLTGSTDNTCCREEIFGPVAFLIPFSDEAEAIRIVNDTTYGLANSVWTKDEARAARMAAAMEAGSSWINGHNLPSLGVPYGGWNGSGCGGGVCSSETLMDYFRTKAVTRKL